MPKSRKEISKDIMYGKIMPSSLQRHASSPPVAPLDAAEPESAALLARETATPTPAELFDQNGVKLQQQAPALVVNLSEYLVSDKLEAAFAKFRCCQCDKCKKDVAAMALNLLKPHYVVARQEELDGLLLKYNGPEVSSAIIKAILQVRNHPRH